MDFYELLDEVEEGFAYNPYAGKQNNEWIEGTISIDFLNKHFGHLETCQEMKNATESEGLRLYFDWLKQQGILD